MKHLYITLLFIALGNIMSYAQPANIVLNSAESGPQQHQALNSITFAPGYSCTVVEGSILAEIVIESFSYPNPPSYASSEPEEAGESPTNFAVSPTGAATLSIPIKVPQGVGGMQPSLAIAYNSQSGNGVAGWGASLTGISAIGRTPKDIYHDGSVEGIKYTGFDAFVLDGKRLIYQSGNHGQEGAIYYPESDPFTKITVHGSNHDVNCDTWFEVESKDGMVYHYGSSSNSRQTIASGRVNAWYLAYVEDPLGNYMNYTYEISSYFYYLKSISYGKNTNQSTSFENKVEMTYETRADSSPFIINGTKGGVYKRLATVTSKTGSTTYRRYELEYENTDHFSRLSTVTEENGAGEGLKPTKLYWNKLPSFYMTNTLPTVDDANVYPAVAFDEQSFQAGDMNADGISDLIGVFPISIPNGQGGYNHTNYAYTYWGSIDANGNPQFLTGSYKDIGAAFQMDDWKEQNAGCSPIDFDGDGTNELLMPHASINEYWQTIEFKFFNGSLNNNAFGYSLQYSSEMPLYATGDFNNDGKGDVVYIEKGHNNNYYPCEIVGLNQGTTLYRASLDLYLPSEPKKIFASDFNGNGLTDVIIFYDDGYRIYWNQGGGIDNDILQNSSYTSSSTIDNDFMIRMGDFNGDHLTDFIMNEEVNLTYNNTQNWYIATNNGNGTFTKNLACSLPVYGQSFTSKDNDKFDCHVFDFDHDGKSDVAIHKAMYKKEDDMWSSPWGEYRETHTYWMKSNGTTLSQVAHAESTNEDDAYSKFMVSGDFNGDGKTELINYGYNCYNASSTSQSWRYYKNSSIHEGSGMLASFYTGLGSYKNLSYASLTNNSFYTKGTSSDYPLVDLTPAISQ